MTKKKAKKQNFSADLDIISTDIISTDNKISAAIALAIAASQAPSRAAATDRGEDPSSQEEEELEALEEELEEEEELICCCLCYAAVDYSDKSYFCQDARDADLEQQQGQQQQGQQGQQPPVLPLLLPKSLYDPLNALVFCDGCDRPYHQRCHFVPIIHLPRGDWHCLICTTTPQLLQSEQQQQTQKPSSKSQKNKKTANQKTKKSKPKKQKQSATSAAAASSSSWTRHQLSSQLYQMNQPSASSPLELKWEHDVRFHKLTAMTVELRRLKSALGGQMQAIRLSQMAMTALTLRRSPTALLKSQELCQTLVKLAGAKCRVRRLLQSLEAYRNGDDCDVVVGGGTIGNTIGDTIGGITNIKNGTNIINDDGHHVATSSTWSQLQTFLEEHPAERKVWFPLLSHAERRMPPRLKDDHQDHHDIGGDANGTANTANVVVVVPNEIRVNHQEEEAEAFKKKDKTKTKKTALAAAVVATPTKKSKVSSSNNNNHNHNHTMTTSTATTTANQKDDDSGLSLDNLKCCICFKGDATDDNDLLLCDGKGCFRSHHMHCLAPIMTQELAAQQDDWFCPLCTALAKLVADVQSEFTGDEWYCEDAGESVTSWDQVNDVFPEAPMEYEMAIKWKEHKMDHDTRTYLKNLFGDDQDEAGRYEHGDANEEDNDGAGVEDGDDEDDEDDDDYNPSQTKASQKEDDEHDDDDDDDASSNATLDDMSSVELRIGRDELYALSGGEQSSDDDDDDDDESKSKNSGTTKGDKARRSRRIRSARASRTNTDDDGGESSDAPPPPTKDIGTLDEANIVIGKRRRRRIDYRLLNDSMFGKLSAKDKAKMDDTDDFQYKHKRKDTTSESESSNDESSSCCDDDSEEEDNEGVTSKEEVSVLSSSDGDATKKKAAMSSKRRKPPLISKAKQPPKRRKTNK